ncbi:hypothetical protein PGT21_001009 [Puccinia graminis f. sp. tritici]|uniref:Uncharacterized protein n=1 Tax=Puccinia graminis f. sp. tritici TaxID=56615 RepID=A0A5B0P4E4_PUCGR|nr:hypothetical protein PGT21_001009 [Puccinia graminis f. sp. tritici]KAA1135082.1 hypothetical protein PGTUg99_003874 [Puccinia graminis f. sp. tritici]
MHKYIEQQQILGDLLMILIFFCQQETNDLIDPVVPSLGRVVAPCNNLSALMPKSSKIS